MASELTTILPKLHLSPVSKKCLRSIWNLFAVSDRQHKKHIKSTIPFKFETDLMQKLSSITGKMGETIRQNKSECTKTDVSIGHRTFSIYIVWYNSQRPNIDMMIRKIVVWLGVVLHYAKSDACSKHVDIFICLTEHKRLLPPGSTPIEVDDLVSAFTHHCLPKNEIYIFREEDWNKAFIHETFHTFGLDFGDLNTPEISQKVGRLMPGLECSDIRVYESYTDGWATICASINKIYFRAQLRSPLTPLILSTRKIAGKSFIYGGRSKRRIMRGGNRTRTTTISQHIPFDELETEISNQRNFGVFQCVKLLKHEGTSMDQLMSTMGKKHVDNILLSSYHVVRPCFMVDINKFIEWTHSHNPKLLLFNSGRMPVEAKIVSFCNMLRENLHSSVWKTALKNAEKLLADTKDKYLLITARMNV